MTDKVYTYIFKLLSQETALLFTKYDNDSDQNLVNDLYSDMLLDVEENESAGFINYLIKLISFLEQKEDYEWCSKLLKLKTRIKNYQNE